MRPLALQIYKLLVSIFNRYFPKYPLLQKLFARIATIKSKTDEIIKINLDKLDLNKNKRSLLPNFIQYLDSALALDVIAQCKHRNIPIMVNHDCFFSILEHDLDLLVFYNLAFFRLILNNNPIEHFIKINNCWADPFIMDLFHLIFDSS